MWPRVSLTVAALTLSLACPSGGGGTGAVGEQTPADKRAVEEQKATTPEPSASLTCEGGTFSKILLKNTKSRSHQGFSARCDLTDQSAGVIWLATGEGFALQDAEKKLVFTDDQGRQFGHTCWTSSGTINGVAQTELILFGPEESRGITVCCGEACATAEIEVGGGTT